MARWDRNARHVHRARMQIPSPQLRQARLLASQSKRTKDCKAMQNKTMHINAKQWKADQCNTERCKTIGNRAMQSKEMQLQFTSVHSTHGHKPESIMLRLQMTIAHGRPYLRGGWELQFKVIRCRRVVYGVCRLLTVSITRRMVDMCSIITTMP